ncbi:MAG: hypothetical protein JWN86_438 [Planctomycetota bacterium]|nr:hypothetical protein [Planctomycetota bacterium]
MSTLAVRLTRLEKAISVRGIAKAEADAQNLERDIRFHRNLLMSYGPRLGEPGYIPPELVGPIDWKALYEKIDRAYRAKEA